MESVANNLSNEELDPGSDEEWTYGKSDAKRLMTTLGKRNAGSGKKRKKKNRQCRKERVSSQNGDELGDADEDEKISGKRKKYTPQNLFNIGKESVLKN